MFEDEHVFELRQVSVFLENRPGVLADATRTLASAEVNLRAAMIAETERFGILRVITDSRPPPSRPSSPPGSGPS